MCGFVGTTEKALVKLMLGKQEHRGPDGNRYWRDDTFAFGHSLLDINGCSQYQPYVTKKGNIVVFNGEMYDSDMQNDTMWLAEGLDNYGQKLVEACDWHGSLAWYKPEENEIVLIRDHFGTKPLWYRIEGKRFEFSTSLKSFLYKKSKNDFREFYSNPQWFGDKTPFINIYKVAPGEVIVYDTKNRRIKRKGNLWTYFDIKPDKVYSGIFRKKITNSIRKVAKNINKTGLFLSGGMDSTLILSLLKDIPELDLHVFSCGYTKELDSFGQYYHDMANEIKMAEQTCREYGIPITTVELSQSKRDHYGKMWLANTHFPWSDKNRTAPRYLLAKTAAEHGCKVILTGDSGDELFTGYIHHTPRLKKDWKFNYNLPKWFPQKPLNRKDQLNDSLFNDLLLTSEQNVLATDQTCGMFGMESRIPLLTQSFAKYVLNIQGSVKFRQHKDYRNGTYKFLMREVMRDYLPDHVKNRKHKTGWASPWDNNHPSIRPTWFDEDIEFIKLVGK